MLKIILSAMCGAVVLVSGSMAAAQAAPGGIWQNPGSRESTLADPAHVSVTTGVLPTRLDRQRHRNGVYTQLPNAAQLEATTQSEMNTANVDCRVAQAALLGYNGDQQGVYEVSCSSGMGYVVASTSPPQVTDCVTLASRADQDRAENPAGPPSLECKMEANRNITRMVGLYARQAGVTCAIDQASRVGTSVSGNAVYEIGCPDADGYWIEKTATGWTTTPCIKVAATGTACRFTTDQESAVSARTWLANTPASACDVTGVRYIGGNSTGGYYETRCSGGEGFVARLDDAMTIQEVITCAEAAGIGGGCKLTAEATANRQ